MNEQSILCFLSIADTHNFSATARSLMITQQAVSRSIQKLEEELGFSLLIRDQNMVILTEAGRHLLRYLKETGQKKQELSLKSVKHDNVIRVGISDWIGNAGWIRDSVTSFYEKYPDYTFVFYEITNSEAKEMAEHQLIDCYLTTNYEMEHISVFHMALPVISSGLCLAGILDHSGDKVHLCSNAGEVEDVCIRTRDIRIYQELGLPIPSFRIYPNNSSVYLNASIGNGVCFMPQVGKMAAFPCFSLTPLDKRVDIVLGILRPEQIDILTEWSVSMEGFLS